jgi:GNAT superfamily N-acetyltransferase
VTRELAFGGASARLWLAHDLVGAPGATGIVGAFRSDDDAEGAALLRAACVELARAGAQRIVGPMEGSTWASYRIVVSPESGDVDLPWPAFPGEPPTASQRPWTDAGFAPVERYQSALVDVADTAPPEKTTATEGVTIRTFRPERFEDELRTLHALSLAAFADNPWYAPIAFDDFRALYDPLRGRIDPALVWFAERPEGTPLGFQFAYPDPGGPGREPGERIVAKTLGVVPAARGLGLGRRLFGLVHTSARERGTRFVVHALIHERNLSRAMSDRRAARVFRRYALFGRLP